ncbi:MAG: PhnD/SsuA/transferrin family substrate-binding protein [Rhodocyclaceae bacterium]|nr:PhnD/SsuA/transferrin family substrate-binding protein [Rhodocyclaceae bacterium]
MPALAALTNSGATILKRALLSVVLCVGWPVAATHATETLVFTPLPQESPETVVAQWKPLLNQVGKALGVTVRIEYLANYGEIIDKFRAGKIDLAQLGPLSYVVLRETFEPVAPLVHLNESDGRAGYTCALVAPAGSKLAARDMKNPMNIKGRTFALTQPLSTCGYLGGDSLLRGAGGALENNRYRYLGQHDAVALAVLRGEFELGSMKTQIARKYAGLGLVVVAESGPLPGVALVANAATVSPERISQIRTLLLDADAATRSGWGIARHGVTPAKDSDYDAVRRLRGQTKIPETGNF